MTVVHDYWSNLQEEDWSGSLVMLTADQIDRQALFSAKGQYLGEVVYCETNIDVDPFTGFQGRPDRTLTIEAPGGHRYQMQAPQIIVIDLTKMLEDSEKIREVWEASRLEDGRAHRTE